MMIESVGDIYNAAILGDFRVMLYKSAHANSTVKYQT